MFRTPAALAFLFIAAASTAAAQGIVIPNEPDLPPLGIDRYAVRTEIDHQAATTSVEQVFVNNTTRRLEAQYLFPIPKGAALTGFTLKIDGKETSGEMIEKDKARHIYQSLVQRTRDAGLLEYLGGEIFRANIFPIEPNAKQTVIIRFASTVTSDSGLIRYLHPVRAGARRGPVVLGESSIDVTIRGSRAIENLYSPSHPVKIARAGDKEARVAWMQKNATLHRDFELYWSQGGKSVALDLVTHRPDPTEPGSFMMLISPGSRLQPGQVVERDVVFVVDTSGSMGGPKIEQARNALQHCVKNLNDGDRFDIVRFSSDIEAWKGEFVPAKDMKGAAAAWIDKLKAAGGTNISGALQTALKYPVDANRPGVVVFLTDGKPTVGETVDPKEIVRRTGAQRAAGVRVFTFGVGYDVDTHLLDGVSEVGRGVSEYVRPEEDIAVKVGAFWEKAGRPVLTDLAMEAAGDKVRLAHVHPSPLPDLFAGTQLVLFGRYTGDGPATVRLTGTVNGRKEAFAFEASFPSTQAKFAFVEPLWARRRIGSLLDAIRLHGESKELVDEVVALAKRYDVQTPYTSWIITEDGTSFAGRSGGALAFDRKADEKLRWAVKPAAAPEAERAAEERAQRDEYEKDKSFKDGLSKKEGKAAVEAATSLRRLKEADKSDGGRFAVVVKAAGTRFIRYRSVWVDERFDAESELTTVKFGSAAYFKLIERKPDLVDALKVGSDVVFVTAKGRALAVCAEGLEEITDEQIEALYQAVVK
ncbi:MAG TPA: VIT domain-containing protein [Planctomycetota bacterium]|nr:VIT domain-containing protein [Planctomycetota bacterium]